jgi:hypothetical protein
VGTFVKLRVGSAARDCERLKVWRMDSVQFVAVALSTTNQIQPHS